MFIDYKNNNKPIESFELNDELDILHFKLLLINMNIVPREIVVVVASFINIIKISHSLLEKLLKVSRKLNSQMISKSVILIMI